MTFGHCEVPLFLYTKRDTHKSAKQLILFLFYLFFVTKIRWKVPPKTYMVKWAFWTIFKKKNLNRHISRRGKKRVLKLPHFEEKKNRFWNHWDLWRIWADFLLLKCVYEGRANPNPLTPKEDDRTDRHLKYYI